MEGINLSGGGSTDLEDVVDVVEDLKETVKQQSERIDELEDERDQLRERVDELESGSRLEWEGSDRDDLFAVSDDGTRYPLGPAVASKVSERELDEQLVDLEERLADGDLADAGDQEDATVETETPLEDVVALPEHIAEEKLSPNQLRARFVASDVPNYGDRTQAGWLLKTSEVRRVLRAGTEAEGHDETIRRVMRFIDELGKDETQIRKKNGERRVFVGERAAKRLQQLGDLETHVSVSRAEA